MTAEAKLDNGQGTGGDPHGPLSSSAEDLQVGRPAQGVDPQDSAPPATRPATADRASSATTKLAGNGGPATEADRVPVDLEPLTSLAHRLVDRGRLDEAAELFELALKVEPKNVALKLGLAQLRRRRRQHHDQQQNSSEQRMREELRRDAIDAEHFLGLAQLYERCRQPTRALEMLEIACDKAPTSPRAHRRRAEILHRQGRLAEAASAVELACRYDPFDAEAADLRSRVEMDRRHYRAAIEAAIDVFHLRPSHRAAESRIRQRLRDLRGRLELDMPALRELFRQRKERLQTAYDRLMWQREQHLKEQEQRQESSTAVDLPERKGDRLELALRLRRFELWRELSDEQVFRLTEAGTSELHARGSSIFSYRGTDADLYLVERGSVRIVRPTAYGTVELATVDAGQLLGEVNYITRALRSGDAMAEEPTRLLRFDADQLDQLVAEQPELGLVLYSGLWTELARKLRATNEALGGFFPTTSRPENFLPLRRSQPPEAVEVQTRDKVALFREKGLSSEELETLAGISPVRRFPDGAHLFREGDEGTEMYVILEGRVMISKMIAGAGEEALAILERGEFFGEMSMVDGQPRSADAQAFAGPVTVIALSQPTVQEVMATDPVPALSFMALLTGLISRRLRELDEKVTLWRIVSKAAGTPGALAEGASHPA